VSYAQGSLCQKRSCVNFWIRRIGMRLSPPVPLVTVVRLIEELVNTGQPDNHLARGGDFAVFLHMILSSAKERQGSAGGRSARRPRSLTLTPCDACCSGRRRRWVGPGIVICVFGVRATGRFSGCGQARLGLAVIRSCRRTAWSAATGAGGWGQSRNAHLADGGQDNNDPCPSAVEYSCGGGGQATDLSVAQPVEDQFDKLTGGGALTDIGSTARTDLVAELPDAGVACHALDHPHYGSADQLAALLGD